MGIERGQPSEIRGIFEIEDRDRSPELPDDFSRERRLPHLARADDGDDRDLPDHPEQDLFMLLPTDHVGSPS